MKVLIDNGHGVETKGKRSPDCSLLEYKWTREIADMLVSRLKNEGIDAERIVKGDNDVPLQTRCQIVNRQKDVILVSIHVNAAGMGTWMSGRGWSAYTSKGQTKADELATCLYKAAERILVGHKIRKDTRDGDPDIEEDFRMLKHTSCPAVLTENLFMDNREDCKFLLSEKGKKAIVDIHVEGIKEYLKV